MRQIYITDRRSCPNLIESMIRAAESGVELIQIREKDLSGRELLYLTDAAIRAVARWPVKILVNTRVDVALAAGAHGAHLPANSPAIVVWRRIVPAGFILGQSCHSKDEVREATGADLLVYGPVFATPGKGTPVGLESLRTVSTLSTVPVFALGGVTRENAQACIEAGAAGVAAIRMYQEPVSR
jgi:thiamine-phosphate pyrophosphorylase